MASQPRARAAAMSRSPRRYVSAGAFPGSGQAMSASRTYGACVSASEYTAIVPTPNRRQVRMMRLAISPRLATSTRLITASHPIHAVAACALDRLVVDHAQADGQHRARVARVDDAVVVDAA